MIKKKGAPEKEEFVFNKETEGNISAVLKAYRRNVNSWFLIPLTITIVSGAPAFEGGCYDFAVPRFVIACHSSTPLFGEIEFTCVSSLVFIYMAFWTQHKTECYKNKFIKYN